MSRLSHAPALLATLVLTLMSWVAAPPLLAQSNSATPPPALAEVAQPPSLAAYHRLDSGEQLMFQFHARSGQPVDFAALAARISRDYAQTADAFAKRELLDKLRPSVQQALSRAAAQPWLYMDVDLYVAGRLSPYDFDRQGFTTNVLSNANTHYYSDNRAYQLTLNNREGAQFFPVTDEGVARKIEAMRSKLTSMTMRVYFGITGVDLARQHVEGVITRVDLRDANGTVLSSVVPPAQAAKAPEAKPRGSGSGISW